MIEAVFISDIHLHPHNKIISQRFNQFIRWAQEQAIKKIYILGDFFDAWAGDDAMDSWSTAIAAQLYELTQQGIELFFMAGNRDFLLGKKFAAAAGWTVLTEPKVVTLGINTLLLAHGDRYCTKDKAHQLFRKLTRNRLFIWLFLRLPLSYRLRLVNKVRQVSRGNQHQSMAQMDVVPEAIIKHMDHLDVVKLIHGHTHKPGLTTYFSHKKQLSRYVLSDWDDVPVFLCYDYSRGVYFNHCFLDEVNHASSK